MRILIVDDNERIAETLADVLDDQHYDQRLFLQVPLNRHNPVWQQTGTVPRAYSKEHPIVWYDINITVVGNTI